MKTICYAPVGIVHSPLKHPEGAPIQSVHAEDVAGRIEIFPEFEEGLLDIEGFSHLIVLYHFHRSAGYDLQTVPFMDDQAHGIFAIRAPRRPNPIGISTLRLEKRENRMLYVTDLDILDQTPVLDIKPYVEAFDHRPDTRTGWMENHLKRGGYRIKADKRFT